MPQPDLTIEGGFQNPVLDAQSVFRSIMNAMARPGIIEYLDRYVDPPPGLSASVGAIACTLIDADTPLWLDQSFATALSVRSWLAFHTGAPFEGVAGLARFAIAGRLELLPALESFAQGSQEYPDRSTTIILQAETLTEGEELTLSGPGIADFATLAPAPLPAGFRESWTANGSRFPRGVDLILAAPDSIACLPRTTRVKRFEEA